VLWVAKVAMSRVGGFVGGLVCVAPPECNESKY